MPALPQTEESIFTEALEQPTPEARAAFLDGACGKDATLRARVENLLRSHTGAGSFLRKPLAATSEPFLIEKPGVVIGPYKLLQQIGEGGMGVVYMAEQESPVRRRVALKIIKPGMDSRQVIARFEAERQALAMMDHQNIAKVLDAGTTDSGRPYFVMELVHGVPLTKFCDDTRLTPRERLELFVPVCQAIQHAHHKGVIHRDIKPSNILVTMYDDRPVPKVIDFGVAKAVEQRLTEKTLFTQYGTLVGTFEYMSPEQAEMNALGVDTRSDIYSLGVLLYELLTGVTPLDRGRLREAALHEVVQLIKEEEPPRPSIRLSTSVNAPKIAAACRTEPARLTQLLRGELDWIVMKCLEKDRSRRYETANGLARDVQRYLADEPVEACPPSWSYRLRKTARKHRRLLTTAAGFVALLVVGLIVSASLAAWALDSQRRAQDAQRQALAALESEREARREAEAAKEKAETAAQRLIGATRLLNDGLDFYHRCNWAAAHERYTQAAEIEPDLRTIYVHRADLYTKLGIWDRAGRDYDQRLRLAPRESAPQWFEHALLKQYAGTDAEYRRACEEFFEQHQSDSRNSPQYYLVRACVLAPQPVGDAADLVRRAERAAANWHVPWVLVTAGMAQVRAKNYEQAVARFREAAELGGDAPEKPLRLAPLAIALHHLGQREAAERELAKAQQAFDAWVKRMAEEPAGTMPINWWDWLEGLIFLREAQSLVAGVEAPNDPRLASLYQRALATITYGDAFTFMDAGREHVAREAWDQAAASFGQVLDQLPYGFRASSQEMWMCVEMVEQPEVFSRLIAKRADDPRLWTARGRRFANRRQWGQACDDYSKAHELRLTEWSRNDRSRSAGDWSRAGRGLAALTLELAPLRLLVDDREGFRSLCEMIVAKSDDVDDHFCAHAFSRACTLAPDSLSDWTVAVRLAESAVAKEPQVAWHLYGLGAALCRSGQYSAAIERLEESLEVHPTWPGRGQNYAMLALACEKLGRKVEARQWLEKAQSWLDDSSRAAEKGRFGYAVSDYMSDWLGAQALLREARANLDTVVKH